ncbi:MAG: tryptophan synthase subunit alpha [Planctomycetes bacterium]|nr:tryptophan synthase subunit alpha [Planctomycetota bacterium]
MNRLRQSFAELASTGQKRLLPYVTAGYPSLAATVEILRRLDPKLCACVELGIPFSDPIADGPVIQASFSYALEHGFKLDTLWQALTDARDDIALPLVAMVSYSIVYRRNPAAFVADAVAAGIDGLIVPDLSLEEADELARIGHEHDCPLVMLVAPTSDERRRKRIGGISEPFIYYQSLVGVTGERDELPAELSENVRRLRAESGKPVCVGFGVATAAQVAAVCQVADGAIVGSAIVRRIGAAMESDASVDNVARVVADFVSELAQPP